MKNFNSEKKKFQKNRKKYPVNKRREYDLRKREYDSKKRDYYSRQNKFQEYYRNQNEYNPKIQKIHMSNEKLDDQRDSGTDDASKYEQYEHPSSENVESYEKINPSEKNDDESNEQYVYMLSSESPGVCKKCETLKKKFSFNNAFHNHIRVCIAKSFQIVKPFETKIEDFFIIKSVTSVVVENGLAFRNYSYATVWIMVAMHKFIEAVIDSECFVFLINEFYFRIICPDIKSITMTVPMNVKDIENAIDECLNYVVLNIFFDDVSEGKPAREHIHKKFHFVEKLKCKILFGMNILAAERITINTANKMMMISTCKNLIVSIRIAPKSNARIRRVIHVKNQTLIPAKIVVRISTYMKKKKISNDKNYLFEPNQESLITILKKFESFYFHICDENVFCVQIRNDRNISINLIRRARLGTLTEYEKKNCYQIDDFYEASTVIINIKKLKAWKKNSENFFSIIRET